VRIACYGNTDTGLVRDHNEDAFYMSDVEPLYVVADGMGGHNCGEVASRIAVETMAEFYNETAGREAVDLVTKSATGKGLWPFGKRKRSATYEELRIESAIEEGNRRILEAGKADAGKRGMGTTLVGCYFTEGGVFVGHVGDSRCYRFRDGQIEQITEDHSLANEYVRMNILSPEDVEHFPYKNVIVRALGLAAHVQVDVGRHEFQPGDLFLLCSDGLSDMLPDLVMEEILGEQTDAEEAVEELIERANDAGGVDNITVIIAAVEPD
jgi:serine/threonine protein phosphatase PrpC